MVVKGERADGDVDLGSLSRSIRPDAVGHAVARGLSWTFLGQWLTWVVQLGTTMVLARLLTPDEFGLMAMALTLTIVVNQFRQLGLSQAVVQREDLSWRQVNSLFWINVAVGVVLAGIVAATGPALARWYGEPTLVWLCLGLAGGYVISGVAVQHGALLNRARQFRTIALRNVVAGTLSSVAAVIAAFAGAGVWALVIQHVALTVFSSLVTWLAVPWRPSRPNHLREAAPLVKFGANVTGANLFFTMARQADNVIIGRVLDSGALGIYSRAYSLLTLPLRQLKSPVHAVMMPMLAALQNDPVQFRRTYRRAVSGLAHLGMPAVVVLAVTAGEVIDVALGSQWAAAAPIFQILAVASFVQIVSTTSGWLFVSTGRGRAYLAWSFISSVLTVASFILGVRWGLDGVAIAYSIGQVVMLFPAFALACHSTPVPVTDPFRAMLRPLGVACVVLGATATAHELTSGLATLVVLLASVAAGAGSWALAMLLWRSAREEVLALIRTVRRGRTSATATSGTDG